MGYSGHFRCRNAAAAVQSGENFTEGDHLVTTDFILNPEVTVDDSLLIFESFVGQKRTSRLQDLDGDGNIGLGEALHTIQKAKGLRNENSSEVTK